MGVQNNIATVFSSGLEAPPEVCKAIEIDVSRLRILGGAGTGKSFVIAKRTERLLRSGCDPSHVLVIVGNQNALYAMKQQFENDRINVSGVAIVTIRDLCIAILDKPEAIERTGRTPRVINDLEELFILEDLKMIGTKPKRIKEILKFIYREWTELGDDKEGFLQYGEEIDLLTAVRELLITQNAMSPHELSNITCRYLQGSEKARRDASYQHVLIDDYHNLSRASQFVVNLLTLESITVTGNPCQTQESHESYPYPDGLKSDWFGEEQKERGDFETITLTQSMRCPQRIGAAGNALMKTELSDQETSGLLVSFDSRTPLGVLTVIKWSDPDAERKGVAAAIKKRINAEQPVPQSMQPGDILVIVPNRTWGRLFAQELDALSVKYEHLYSGSPLAGNPQRLDASSAMRSYTALTLAAHPDDVLAWRSWCGYGDYFLSSASWNELVLFAKSHGIGIVEALKTIARITTSEEAPFPQAEVLAQTYRKAQELLSQCYGRTGHELIRLLRQGDDATYADFERLVEPIDEDWTAIEVYEKARMRFADPWFQTRDSVRIASLSTAMGLEASLVVFLGTIDGFLPSNAVFGLSSAAKMQERRCIRERHAFYNILSRSNQELIFSFFRRCDVEIAERLSMEIRRIHVEQGRMVALLSLSQFIIEMGEVVPEAVEKW